MEKITSQFLHLLQVPVSKKYVRKIITSHPDFPSLLSIADTLRRFGVDHIVRRITKEELEQLPHPFLLPIEKGNTILVKNKHELTKTLTRLQQWNGVVLQAGASKKISDKTNEGLYAKEKKVRYYTISLLTTLILLISLSFAGSFTLSSSILLITALCGAVISYFLFAKEVGIHYTAIDEFCSSKKTSGNNCDTLLKTDINVFGVKLADASLAYFIFQIIMLGLTQALPETDMRFNVVALSVLGVAALPAIMFSLYYQYFIAKVWCRLCLGVVCILATQLCVFLIKYFNTPVISIGSVPTVHVILFILLFITIGLCVLLVKSIIEHSNKLNTIGSSGDRVKHSIPVFTYLLKRQRKVDTQPFELEMRVGNPYAAIQIIMVSNLYCNPCKQKHFVIDQLVTLYPTLVNVTFRFVKSVRDKESVRYLLSYWIKNISRKENESNNTIKLIHDWFEFRDLTKFKKQYSVESENINQKLESQHYTWIEKSDVEGTPTFFINGHELPKQYGIDDLLTMTPGLADAINTNMTKIETSQVNSR
jgi:hypothetical protein